MEESNTSKSSKSPDYDEIINKHIETKEQSYLPLVFIGLVLLILIIGTIFLLSKNSPVPNTNSSMPVISTPAENPVSAPQTGNLQNIVGQQPAPQPAPSPAPQPAVGTVDYTIQNSDGTNVALKYPSNWTVKVYNKNSTHAFISPSGSAVGYDFAEYTGILPCSTNGQSIADGKMFRYYDATSNAGVNWYVCDYDTVNKMFYVNNYDLFTIYAKNDSDLTTIDQILSTVVRSKPMTAVYMGKNFNASFEYPAEFGKAQNHTSEILVNSTSIECATEAVTFPNSEISVLIQTGFPECIGSMSSPTETLNSRDGKPFALSVYQFQQNPNKYTITSKFGTGDHPSWGMNITVGGANQNVTDDNKDTLTNQIKFITQSSLFDIGNLKSNNFDEVQNN